MQRGIGFLFMVVLAAIVFVGVARYGDAAFNFYPGCTTCDMTLRTLTATTVNATNLPAKHSLVRITASLCSTDGTIAHSCNEPTVTGLPFADTNYTASCICVGTPTGVPGAITIAKTAATNGVASAAVVTLYAATGATASCTEVDCDFWHD